MHVLYFEPLFVYKSFIKLNLNYLDYFRCLSRLKYREKNKEKIAAKEKANGVVKKARQGRPKKVPKKEDFITDESEVSEDGEWLPPSNTGKNRLID